MTVGFGLHTIGSSKGASIQSLVADVTAGAATVTTIAANWLDWIDRAEGAVAGALTIILLILRVRKHLRSERGGHRHHHGRRGED